MSTDDSKARISTTSVWQPTQAYLRACVLAVSLLLAAMLFHNAGLTVLATPFLVVTAWSLVTRPRQSPKLRYPTRLPILREGEAMSWRLELEVVPGLDQAAMLYERAEYQDLAPESGAVSAGAASPAGEQGSTEHPVVTLSVLARSTRWGSQEVGRTLVSATSTWAAFRWGQAQISPLRQVTLPLLAVFEAEAPTPHPVGLVGLNRAARRGEGSEFATIRPFQIGDRLRRINWPVSLRTQTLSVTATWADQDAEVMLVVDASTDLGASEGIGGHASSLDVTVRAAGAIAEHFLRRGDRVGLCTFGPDVVRLPPGGGQPHLLRVLQRLAETKVGNRAASEGKLLRLRLGAESIVIMLSACISQLALRQAVTFVGRGLTVIVVDTLPAEIGGIDSTALAAAWRIRRLEREVELRRLANAGVPVVTWHGPGSLDQVLRDLGRRAAAPRMGPR